VVTDADDDDDDDADNAGCHSTTTRAIYRQLTDARQALPGRPCDLKKLYDKSKEWNLSVKLSMNAGGGVAVKLTR